MSVSGVAGRIYARRVARMAAGAVAMCGSALAIWLDPSEWQLSFLKKPRPHSWGGGVVIQPEEWSTFYKALGGAWAASVVMYLVSWIAMRAMDDIEQECCAGAKRTELWSLMLPLAGWATLGSTTTTAFFLDISLAKKELLVAAQAIALLGCVLVSVRLHRQRQVLGEMRAYGFIVGLGCLSSLVYAVVGGPLGFCAMIFLGPLEVARAAACWLFLPVAFVGARWVVTRERSRLEIACREPQDPPVAAPAAN